MIWRGFAERQAQESFERQAIVDLVFKLGIRMDACPVKCEAYFSGAEPLLQHQAFEKQQRRIGVSAFSGCADSVMIH
jgi:hypothetical protein